MLPAIGKLNVQTVSGCFVIFLNLAFYVKMISMATSLRINILVI